MITFRSSQNFTNLTFLLTARPERVPVFAPFIIWQNESGGNSRLSVVVRETLSEEGTIGGFYTGRGLCLEYWGIVLRVELITDWDCGAKKNILSEEGGAF